MRLARLARQVRESPQRHHSATAPTTRPQQDCTGLL